MIPPSEFYSTNHVYSTFSAPHSSSLTEILDNMDPNKPFIASGMPQQTGGPPYGSHFVLYGAQQQQQQQTYSQLFAAQAAAALNTSSSVNPSIPTWPTMAASPYSYMYNPYSVFPPGYPIGGPYGYSEYNMAQKKVQEQQMCQQYAAKHLSYNSMTCMPTYPYCMPAPNSAVTPKASLTSYWPGASPNYVPPPFPVAQQKGPSPNYWPQQDPSAGTTQNGHPTVATTNPLISQISQDKETEDQPTEQKNDAEKNEDDTEMWYYKDPAGIEQGPFSSEQMEAWKSESLWVRRSCDKVFIQFEQLNLRWESKESPFVDNRSHSPILSPDKAGIKSPVAQKPPESVQSNVTHQKPLEPSPTQPPTVTWNSFDKSAAVPDWGSSCAQNQQINSGNQGRRETEPIKAAAFVGNTKNAALTAAAVLDKYRQDRANLSDIDSIVSASFRQSARSFSSAFGGTASSSFGLQPIAVEEEPIKMKHLPKASTRAPKPSPVKPDANSRVGSQIEDLKNKWEEWMLQKMIEKIKIASKDSSAAANQQPKSDDGEFEVLAHDEYSSCGA